MISGAGVAEAHDLRRDELLSCFVVDGEENTSRLFDHCRDHKTCKDVVFQDSGMYGPASNDPSHFVFGVIFKKIKND